VLDTADDVRGDDPSLLPETSLDGEIATRRYDARLSTRVADPVTVEATARYYDYEDKTPRLDFPGYAAFGESAFRRSIGQVENDAAVLFNDPSDYRQTRLGLSARWRISAPYFVTAGYERQRMDYDGRQVEGTDEDILTARLQGGSGPADWRVHYQGGRREQRGAYEFGLELSMLRMFDVWSRNRDRFGRDTRSRRSRSKTRPGTSSSRPYRAWSRSCGSRRRTCRTRTCHATSS
jgi:hypothetical protein